VVADTTLGGTDLPAGSRLLLLWGAANRDPAQFDAPNDFRLDRPGGNVADLFAERGPAATSIRDIAARSRVNHGLIHRHVGGKDARRADSRRRRPDVVVGENFRYLDDSFVPVHYAIFAGSNSPLPHAILAIKRCDSTCNKTEFGSS
jgi:hypothetical protein